MITKPAAMRIVEIVTVLTNFTSSFPIWRFFNRNELHIVNMMSGNYVISGRYVINRCWIIDNNSAN